MTLTVIVVVQALMTKKLGLTTTPHPKHYKLQWIKEDEDIVVKEQVSVPIFIGIMMIKLFVM